jgi:hypothetical protein
MALKTNALYIQEATPMTQVIVIKEAVENKKQLTYRIPRETLGKINERSIRLARFSIPSSVLFVHENQPVYIHIENTTTNVSANEQLKSCTFLTNPTNVSAQSVEYGTDYAVEIPKSVKNHTTDLVIHVRSLMHETTSPTPVILPNLSTFSSVVLECNGNKLSYGENDIIPYGRYDAGIFTWPMISDLVDNPGATFSTETVMFTQSHGTSFSSITKVFLFKGDASGADACFLQLRPHMCNCKLTGLHVEYRMQECPPNGAYTVAEMNAALHQTTKWNVMTFQEILDRYPANSLLSIIVGTLTIDESAKSGEIHVDTPTVKCPKCFVSGRWQINTCTGFLIKYLGLQFPPTPPTTDASFQLCTARIVSSQVFGIDKRDSALVSCNLNGPFWITDSFWLVAYQHTYKKKTFTHDWRIRCAHAPNGCASKVDDLILLDTLAHRSTGVDASGLTAAVHVAADSLATVAEFVEYWNEKLRLYEYHVSVKTIVQPFNATTTCIFLLNGERVLTCLHPVAMMQMNASRLDAQIADIERTIRNHESLQQTVRVLTANLSQHRTSALEQELMLLKHDPLYTMSVASYEKEKESVVKSLQMTMESVKSLASTDLVFEVIWSSVFYTTRFDLNFESLHANVMTPRVSMLLSLYVDALCIGTCSVNSECSKFEFVCTTPFLAKKALFKCSNVQEASWRMVSVSPMVLSGSYELARPIQLWGDARNDARCMLLQTSPVELEIPIDMCPVHSDQKLNTFPIFCPHKPSVNSYLWFLDSSASWMLVPYKRNISHIHDKSSSILQIGMFLT